MKRYIRSDTYDRKLSVKDKIQLARTSTDAEILDEMAAKERSYKVLYAITKNPNTSDTTLRKLIKRAETSKFMQQYQGDVTPAYMIFMGTAGRKHVPADILEYLVDHGNSHGIDNAVSAGLYVIRRPDSSYDLLYRFIRTYCNPPHLTSLYPRDILEDVYDIPDDVLEYFVQSEFLSKDDRKLAAERLGMSEEEFENIELTDLSFDEFMSQNA